MDKWSTFFRLLFRDFDYGDSAFLCLARREAGSEKFEEEFFKWPKELPKAIEFLERFVPTHDLWYGTQLYSRRRRLKEYALSCPFAWADLDACPPDVVEVTPSILIESSPNRYQGIWLFNEPLPPLDGELISKRIYHAYKHHGCDACWNLTRILRIPYTHNFKYGGIGLAPEIIVVHADDSPIEITAFDIYPKLEEDAYTDIPFPDEIPEPQVVLWNHRGDLHPTVYHYINVEPIGTWSETLWKLENMLIESGLDLTETFAVVRSAACNKYDRDRRSEHALWRECCRAWSMQQEQNALNVPALIHETRKLLTDSERDSITSYTIENPSYIERYINWASGLGDAAIQYHQAGAFVSLSSVLAGGVRLPTSFGTVIPNLWFMLLADTTLTRKTTSMDIAMDLIAEVNDSAILATDGSIEGLFLGLSVRPGTPSIFLRDEFSGLLESMTKRDYYAGMSEMLTKLYDGKYQKRVLKKEVIEVREPILIIYSGGIKNRIYELLTHDQVTSGFLPRFIFITAEADLTKMKPVGPPTIHNTNERIGLIMTLKDLSDFYNKVETSSTSIRKKQYQVSLDTDAWVLYNRLEASMLAVGMESQNSNLLTPTFDRLAKSGLKAAMLIAAADKKADAPLVTEQHMLHAFLYVEQWMAWAIEVLGNIGKSSYEKTADLIVEAVRREPGILRGTIMKMFRLSARQADDILSTLEQRGQIRATKSGKSIRLEVTV